jgi:hypothetical protein
MRNGIDLDKLENLGDDLVPQVEVRAYLSQSWPIREKEANQMATPIRFQDLADTETFPIRAT